MKLLYWLNEWGSLPQPEQQVRLPLSGHSLIDDVFVRYELVDVTKPLLFTFSPSGTNVQEQDLHPHFAPWGYHFAQQQNINIIAFQHLGVTNWFRSPSLIAFLELLSMLLSPFKCRLGYGWSRGGFAISAFAHLLQLDHVLLFYPVSTKNKMLVPWDDRPSTDIAQQFDWEGDYHDKDLGHAQGYIVYDPTDDIDRLHAKRYPELTHFQVVGMGHGLYSHDFNKLDFYNQVAEQFIHHQKIDIADFHEQAKHWFLKEDG